MIEWEGNEPVTVRGYKHPDTPTIHLYATCGVAGIKKREQFVSGIYTVNFPRQEICGSCYKKKRREDRYGRR